MLMNHKLNPSVQDDKKGIVLKCVLILTDMVWICFEEDRIPKYDTCKMQTLIKLKSIPLYLFYISKDM